MLGVKKSSPRLAARDGMEQEPYEFWVCSMNPESKGKATYGAVREHAFPRFTKVERIFLALRLTASLGVRLALQDFHQERTWVIKRRWPEKLQVTSTTRSRSKF